MLIEFRVGNYRSFRDAATLSMVATKTTGPEESVRQQGGMPVSTVAAVYGANASGKSNLIDALALARSFVLDSAREGQAQDPVPVVPFALDDRSGKEPSEFEFVFVHEGVRYRYGFRADRARVLEEWLFHRPSQRETNLFYREADSIEVHRAFKGGSRLIERTRPNALFLSVAAQFNSETALRLMEWFGKARVIHGIDDTYFSEIAAERLTDQEARHRILRFLNRWDPTVRGVESGWQHLDAEDLPPHLPWERREGFVPAAVYEPVVRRARYSADGAVAGYTGFSLDDDESEGLQKLFQLAVPIPDALQFGLVLVIDELDARLHPLITRALIELFAGQATNPHNAQLVFATHDTNLLDRHLLRRDQIWFTEKNHQGATDLYSLVEFMPRPNGQFERDYIHGRYGAIPFIGGLHGLAEPHDATTSQLGERPNGRSTRGRKKAGSHTPAEAAHPCGMRGRED
jgi:AAA15 family ATPase/GTPase